jgi:hypothetical protein
VTGAAGHPDSLLTDEIGPVAAHHVRRLRVGMTVGGFHMHDKNGTPLRVGDVISVEYVITEIVATEDYCNVNARSVISRKPDGAYEHYVGNAAVTVLVNRATSAEGSE